MRELFHPRIMTSLIRATNYHKNAMNNIISEIIARCDLTPALAHPAVGWSRLTPAAYARSAYQIEESEFHCLGRRQNPKTSGRDWSCTLKMKLGKISAISEKDLRVIATLTFLSVSVHSRSLTSSHIGYMPDPFPSAACATRAKWPADGWGLVYETRFCMLLMSSIFVHYYSLLTCCLSLQCQNNFKRR